MAAPNLPIPAIQNTEKRTRPHRPRLPMTKEKIAQRVVDFAARDRENRSEERDRRLQRYAKLRMWVEDGGEFPWPESSNFGIPDMATSSLRTQDTLHNAFMSHRPPMEALASMKQDKDKEETINDLLDHQFFVDQPGEHILEEAADCFVNEGCLTIFVPWVRDKRSVRDLRFFPPIPEDSAADTYFGMLLDQEFSQHSRVRRDEDGWDYDVAQGRMKFRVSFYTDALTDRVKMVIDREALVFDGPRVIVKEMDDVLTPPRCANLQPPGPSNPEGAPHVILVERPTLDEIRRQQKSGFYDRVTEEDLKTIDIETPARGDDDLKEQQKDAMTGERDDPNQRVDSPEDQVQSQKRLEMYICFDRMDMDGDGLDEDVIWWVLKDSKLLLKGAHMSEMYPMSVPRRPFGESTFLPMKGRREGMGLLELMESTHDLMKELWDQMVDTGTLALSPPGFYKPQSNIKPEVLTVLPGDLYPLNDPTRDVAFPQMGNPSQSFSVNALTMAKQWQDMVTVIGELNLGRVPAGKSSAFRTAEGIQTILSQSEARPERILRRFFMAFKQVWWLMHEQNRFLLSPGKKFRIVGYKPVGKDPYRAVESRDEIAGSFEFDFQANVANSSKVALQQAIGMAIGMVIQPLAVQMGIATPEKVYNLVYDGLRALGLDGDRYAEPPMPGAHLPRIFAEEAISAIIHEQTPYGVPAEQGGFQEHLMKLQEFVMDKEGRFGVLSQKGVELFRTYLEKIAEEAARERKLEAQVAAASAAARPLQAGRPGPQGAGPGNLQNPQVQPNEILDETLPTAGGGGNLQ